MAGSRTLYSERLGTMGYALNAGIASVLACPEPKGAVVLAGDGGFQMTLNVSIDEHHLVYHIFFTFY